jgi:glycosyltransferase involved in cell wall biosynthesis
MNLGAEYTAGVQVQSLGKYVCAHCSGRDWYQLPAALEEAGLLEVFCTDFYSTKRNAAWFGSAKARGRRAVGGSFPDSKVKISWATVAMQQLSRMLIRDDELRAKVPDDVLMRMLSRVAAARGANILTYEPWTVKRPAGGFPGGRRQVVFHCHPHVDTEDRIYAQDRAGYSDFYRSSHVTLSPWRRRTADAWKQADLVICASSFSKASLMAAGLPERKCAVVPYGTGRPSEKAQTSTHVASEDFCGRGGLKLLFVGRNPLRKGLHHLLLAWKAANRKPGDKLTIVCREKTPELAGLSSQRGVEWRDSVSEDELHRLYRESDALVVPSLCEGFGHVYLEAMSFGCPVVGTDHSVLADIGGGEAGVFRVAPGNVAQLAELISAASSDPSVFASKREQAALQPRRFSWEAFRRGVATAIKELEPGGVRHNA